MAKRYKKSEPLNRWVALIMALISIFMGTVFSSTLFLNQPIAREDAIELTCIFEDYKGGTRHLKGGYTEITLIFKDGSKQYIDSCCLSYELCEEIENITSGTEIKLLINPNNNYVIELIANDKKLLDFDTTQKDLKNEGLGFFILGLVMYIFAIIFIVQAMFDLKKKINRARTKKNVKLNK